MKRLVFRSFLLVLLGLVACGDEESKDFAGLEIAPMLYVCDDIQVDGWTIEVDTDSCLVFSCYDSAKIVISGLSGKVELVNLSCDEAANLFWACVEEAFLERKGVWDENFDLSSNSEEPVVVKLDGDAMKEASKSGLPWGQCQWCGKVVTWVDVSNRGALYESISGSILGFWCNRHCYEKWKDHEERRNR